MMIENNRYRMECSTKAAEITSFFDKQNNIEYIWSGDSKYWSGRNPILFPVIGSSYNKKYWFDGKEYTMGNHGFARNSDFVLVEQTDDSIILCLSSNDVTKAQYPFTFDLFVTYRLIDDTIIINYRIVNLSNKKMPFAFGLHPAFNCPLTSDKVFDDYYLEFASACEVSGNNPAVNQGLIDKIKLNYELFNKYKTLSFDKLASPYLSFTDGNHGVRVSTTGYNKVAVWTPQAPFICLEPWHASINKCDKDLDFSERDASFILNQGQSFLTTYTISVF